MDFGSEQGQNWRHYWKNNKANDANTSSDKSDKKSIDSDSPMKFIDDLAKIDLRNCQNRSFANNVEGGWKAAWNWTLDIGLEEQNRFAGILKIGSYAPWGF